jgi:hypothetical protein
MEAAFVELLEAFDFAVTFDSTSFCRRDSDYGASCKRKRGSVSGLSLGSYGSDYFSLQDKARTDSDCFSLSGIADDYRVPTGYFGHDAKHKNRRGSDLTIFIKRRNEPKKLQFRTTKSEGDLPVEQHRRQLQVVNHQGQEISRQQKMRPKSNLIGFFLSRRVGSSP